MPIWPFFFTLFLIVMIWGMFKYITFTVERHVTQTGWMMLSIIGAMGSYMSWQIGHLPPLPMCTAHAGQKVQWAESHSVKVGNQWVFIPVDHDPQHYCQVSSLELYNMGVGYTLAHDYRGYLIDKP